MKKFLEDLFWYVSPIDHKRRFEWNTLVTILIIIVMVITFIVTF